MFGNLLQYSPLYSSKLKKHIRHILLSEFQTSSIMKMSILTLLDKKLQKELGWKKKIVSFSIF